MSSMGIMDDAWKRHIASSGNAEVPEKAVSKTDEKVVAVVEKTVAPTVAVKPKVIYSCSSGSSFWQK